MAVFFPADVPEYNRISDEDSLLVQAAKRAAQQRQLQNAAVNPAAGFNAGDYNLQLQGFSPQGLPLPSGQVQPQQVQPQQIQQAQQAQQAQQQTPAQYEFNADEYKLGLPSFQRQGFAQKVFDFPQQSAAQGGVPSNQQDTLDRLRQYWNIQGVAPQRDRNSYSAWDALADVARAYAFSKGR